MLPAGGKGASKKRHRRNPEDEYDSGDSFIDDSEIKAQQRELRKLKVKTKHSGFYAHGESAIAAEYVEFLKYTRFHTLTSFLE